MSSESRGVSKEKLWGLERSEVRPEWEEIRIEGSEYPEGNSMTAAKGDLKTSEALETSPMVAAGPSKLTSLRELFTRVCGRCGSHEIGEE